MEGVIPGSHTNPHEHLADPGLGIGQGFAELLPVSSSAHVVLAEKVMGLDPTAPDMTFLLVTLHTGTMFAVIAYFWRSWCLTYFESASAFRSNGPLLQRQWKRVSSV